MKTLTLVLAAVALAVPASPQQGAAVAPLSSVVLPPELDRVLRDYERAWTSKDAQALANLFAEDGFVLANGRPPVRGRTAIREAYSGVGGGPLHLRAFDFGTADGVGYILGGYADVAEGADIGKFTLVLKRGGSGLWLIQADMDNPNRRRSESPPPPPAPGG